LGKRKNLDISAQRNLGSQREQLLGIPPRGVGNALEPALVIEQSGIVDLGDRRHGDPRQDHLATTIQDPQRFEGQLARRRENNRGLKPLGWCIFRAPHPRGAQCPRVVLVLGAAGEYIHLALPMARDLKIVIAIEEVWNKFLLSPLEFARYVDEFESPWVRAYFDIGNVVLFAFPQDWIRALGPRIVKIHLKDFSMDRRNSRYAWKNLGEGDIDWPEVRKALGEIKYGGYVTTELPAGDAAS